MKSNNKPDSLVAACFGMAASFVIIAALSGCGGGAGSGGIDSNTNDNSGGGNAPDIANATASVDGNTYTISSFKSGLGEFSLIENANPATPAAAANATAAVVGAHATEGTQSVDVNFISQAANLIGLKVDNSGLSDWSPYRYVSFDVTTGASAFDGVVVVQSANWSLTCEGSGAVAANNTGTVTLDMDTCGANIDKTAVNRLQLRIGATTAAGHFYIDKVRLEKGVPVPPAHDIADATTSLDGNTFTISSFKTGLSGFVAIDDADHDVTVANAAATVDTTTANATEGDNSVKFTVTALPTVGADPWIGLVSRTNGGLADWSPYRYLRFSVKTGAVGFEGMLAIKSGSGYTWCGGPWASIPANSSGTVELDLTAPLTPPGGGCEARNLADVRHHLIFAKSIGTYYIDNVRLEKDTTPPPPPPAVDIVTLGDFESGLGSFVGMDDWGGSARATGSVALDTVAANASQGVQSVSATVSTLTDPNGKYGVGATGNGGVADWSAYRFLKADITTTTGSFNGAVGASFGASYKPCASSWTWINAGTSSVTLVADLSKCGLTADDFIDVKRFQVYSDQVGTFNVDNIRLEKEGADIADATTSTDGNTFTISSFGSGIGSFSMIENFPSSSSPASPGDATAAADTVAANAAQGTHSVDMHFIQPPSTAGNTLGFTLDGNGGLADWTPYRYLRFDVTAGVSAFDGEVVVQSGGWAFYCNAAGKVEANHVGTVTLDLNWCVSQSKIDKAAVQRLQLRINNTATAGHFYIDNVRLTKN